MTGMEGTTDPAGSGDESIKLSRRQRRRRAAAVRGEPVTAGVSNDATATTEECASGDSRSDGDPGEGPAVGGEAAPAAEVSDVTDADGEPLTAGSSTGARASAEQRPSGGARSDDDPDADRAVGGEAAPVADLINRSSAPVAASADPALDGPTPVARQDRRPGESQHEGNGATTVEITEGAIVRFRADQPQQGWRGALYKASGGLVNPGVGPSERARQATVRRIRRPLPGSHRIAVSSMKGGVGKTTVVACLGLVLAENRGDRVIALDANPDAGTLADRLTGETSVTVRDLLDNINPNLSLTDVARYTSIAGRLHVLASEQDPERSEAFDRQEYERVTDVLTRYYNIQITDSGTGLVHSAMEGTLALADSLVIMGGPTVDGANRASKTLDWLAAHGYGAYVEDAVVVLSWDRSSGEVDPARIREHFQARCRSVVEVPHDPHLATGGQIELSRLRNPALDAFLDLAALLADGFPG